MEIVCVVRERRWLDANSINAALARGQAPTVRTTRLRRSASAEMPGRAEVVAEEVVHLLRLLATPALYRGRKLFVCSAGHWSCLAFARVLGLLGRRPRVYAYNFYLHELGSSPAVRLVLRALLGRSVRILVQSGEDESYFRDLSRSVEIERVPYCQDPVEVDEAAIGDRGYVFAGGCTNRDYDLVVRLANRLPDVPFVIACSRLNGIPGQVPANVEIRRDLGWKLSTRRSPVPEPSWFRFAAVGSSGQMVTLATMQLGKATVVPDVEGVAQYVVDGASGIVYQLGDEDAVAAALDDVRGDPERLDALGRAAQGALCRVVHARAF